MSSSIIIKGIDHLVVTVSDINRSCQWYETMLGMKAETFTSPSDRTKTRVALVFGDQKINLHEKDIQVTPLAQYPRPGSTDLCLWTDQPVATHILPHWLAMGGAPLRLERGDFVVQRTGAQGPLTSVYIHDPDGNLIEVANRSF